MKFHLIFIIMDVKFKTINVDYGSVDRQVIVTTYSPELLKYSKLEDILLISRDGNGFYDIKRIVDNEVVKSFIG